MPDENVATAPDPATTTSPESTITNNSTPSDWDALDIPDSSMPTGDGEFTEDREAREAAEAEAAAAEATETPADEVVEEPTAETTDEPVADPDVEKKLEQFEFWDKQLADNPAGVAEALINNMPAHQKAALLAKLGVGAQSDVPAFDVDGYEPQGDMETALKARWNDLNAIPEVSRQLATHQQEFGQYRQSIEPQIAYANVNSEVQAAKLDAICEVLGIELSDPDVKAIEKALATKGTTYRDAVRKNANYTKQVELAKQTRAPRPRTPGNQSRQAPEIKEGADMLTIARSIDPNFGRR